MFDVVMPLYNKGKFVEATIESVLAQRHGEWRLFVVDDGSSDNGVELVRRFSDPRVKLIEQSNKGVGPARNRGIREGTADWIAFLDADDVWNPDHLEELAALRTAFPEAVLLGCAFRRFSGAVEPGPSARQGRRRLSRYFADCARGQELLVTSSAAVSRAALAAVGDFKPLPGNEDVELWARLALTGPVAVSSRQTVNYRVDSGGITDTARRMRVGKPLRRAELSSAIPTLEDALPGLIDPTLRQDVNDYMDSRIGVRLVAAVLEGDMAYARQLRSLYRGNPKGKAMIGAAIARLPAPLARMLIRTGQRLRLR